MPNTSTPPDRTARGDAWVVAAPAAALARLQPLIQAHRRRREVCVVETPEAIGLHLNHAAAVLIVGGRGATPRRALPGVFLAAPNGARVPAGWLPDAGARLANYARTAGAVLERDLVHERGPAVVLGEFDTRALALVDRLASALAGTMPVFNWTAQRLTCDGLIAALGTGPGIAVYFGHGLAGGWAGYGGFGRDQIADMTGTPPIGAILSLSCSAASRPRRGLSFCEEAVLSGVCAAALGARGRTLHARNAELGTMFARGLQDPSIATLADLLLAVPAGALDRYRVLGDPLAPLLGASGCEAAARQVFAPGPDDTLPVVPLAGWQPGRPAELAPRGGVEVSRISAVRITSASDTHSSGTGLHQPGR
jgi:hypothetical protein